MANFIPHPMNILRHIHPRSAGRMAYVGGGSKAPATQNVVQSGHTTSTSTSTVTNQNIPREFFPYFERMLVRGEEASLQPYIPYGGPRIADQTGDSLASQQMVRDIVSGGNPALQYATGTTAQNMGAAQQFAGLPGYNFSEFDGFQQGSADPYGGFQAFDFGPDQTFDSQAAAQYMSPFIQNVLDVQKDRASRDFLEAQATRNARATGAGAFGGSRQAVMESLASRDMLDRMREIDATGMQAAYTDAQRMFEADRQARMMTNQARAAEQARVQQGQVAELARTQGISLDEAARVQAARAGEFGRVQTSQAQENMMRDQFGLEALGQSSSMAAQLAALSEQGRAADIQNAQMLEALGRSNEARTQAGLDLAYEDFIRQRDYPMQQLQQFSAMINGLPVLPAGTGGSTQTTSVPYNPVQQALGMGISALGLYRGLTA